jgi:hypothetical protein
MVKIGKNIVYRYESKIKNGLTFIFNIDTGKIVVSSKMAYDLLKFIENNDELQDIQHFSKENYNITSSELNNFLEILIENKMIII